MAAGIKYEGVLDFTVVKLDAPGSVAARVHARACARATRSSHGREVVADGRAQVLAVISKNANVFTPHGEADTSHDRGVAVARSSGSSRATSSRRARASSASPCPWRRSRRPSRASRAKLRPGALDEAARAILTTDRGPKVCSVRVGDLVVCAMAKGAGMIEPNMATMLVYFFTNADVDGASSTRVLPARWTARSTA